MKDSERDRIVLLATALLKALAHDRRLMIVCELTNGERTVGDLERVVGLSQSALSQHLARLRRAGVVRTRREAQRVYYALASGEASRLVETLADLYCAPGADRPSRGPSSSPPQSSSSSSSPSSSTSSSSSS